METIIEILFWPIGEAVGSIFSGFWSILERSGDNGFDNSRSRTVAWRGPCAYCRKAGGRFVTCRNCRTPHHQDCARVNGRCAVYACRNRRFLVPAA